MAPTTTTTTTGRVLLPVGGWFNFRTREFSDSSAVPTTDDEARDYIPQGKLYQSYYRLLRGLDCNIINAMRLVLEASIPPTKEAEESGRNSTD